MHSPTIRTLGLILVALLLKGCQAAVNQQYHSLEVASITRLKAQLPTTVPMVSIENYLATDVTVEGWETVLALDTGSRRNYFFCQSDPRLCDRVELASRSSEGSVVKAPEAGIVEALELASFRISNAPVLLFSLLSQDCAAIINEAGLRGVLGNRLFFEATVEADMVARTLTFHDPAAFTYAGEGVIIPLTFKSGRPFISIDLQSSGRPSRTISVMFDTGARGGLTLRHGILPPSGTGTVVRCTASGEVKNSIGLATQARAGGWAFGEVLVEIEPPGVALAGGGDGILGMALISKVRRLIIDFARDRVIVEP